MQVDNSWSVSICDLVAPKEERSILMSENNPDRLEHWRDHLEDYVLVRFNTMTPSGLHVSFLVFNTRKRMHYPIEDAKINQKLVDEMKEAGIKTVSFKENFKMLNFKVFTSEEQFEKYWQHNFGNEE